jgi:hypothetical protein
VSELTITDADREAHALLPEGWFEWHDCYGFRCPEFRLRRLVKRGLAEQKITGKWPDIEVRYRKLKGNEDDG